MISAIYTDVTCFYGIGDAAAGMPVPLASAS